MLSPGCCLLALVAGGIWLANAIADASARRMCGIRRRNCRLIDNRLDTVRQVRIGAQSVIGMFYSILLICVMQRRTTRIGF